MMSALASCCQSPLPKQIVLAYCKLLLSSIISVVSFLGTRWCQEPLCSCSQYKAFACFVPQWEDASGLVCRLFRNCFSPRPPGAVSQLCLSVTVLAGPCVSSNQGRDLWSGKMSQRWAGMRGGRGRRSSGLWAEFSDCAIQIFSGICFLSGFKFKKSIVFSKRRETAKAVQAQVHNELIPVQLSALQVGLEAAACEVVLSSDMALVYSSLPSRGFLCAYNYFHWRNHYPLRRPEISTYLHRKSEHNAECH